MEGVAGGVPGLGVERLRVRIPVSGSDLLPLSLFSLMLVVSVFGNCRSDEGDRSPLNAKSTAQ